MTLIMKRYSYALLIILSHCTMAWGQSSEHNYVKTVTYLNNRGTDSIVSVQYYDGLGRPDLQIAGGNNTTGKYLYTFTEYDGSNREYKVWSSIVGTTGLDYMPISAIPMNSQNTYSDSKAYSQITYDALDRPLFVSAPGETWGGKGKSTEYITNGNKEVRLITSSSLYDTSSFYASGTLIGTRTWDEDSTSVLSYKDMLGRVVLERKDNADTYYVYNDINQLVYILQPMFQEDANLDLYAFQYTYDERGRVKTKKLPGCDPIEYWYDNADRIIKMQDGLLREAGKFRTYEYDALGRMVKQCLSNGSRVLYDEIINYYDTDSFLDAYGTMTYRGPVYYLLRSAHKHSYLLGTKQRASNGEELLTTFAYDDYGRVCRKGEIGLNKQLTITDYTYNFVGDVTSETTEIFKFENEYGNYDNILEASITNKYEAPHTNLLTSSLLKVWEDNSSHLMTDTIQKLTYDDFGHIIGNNRSGTAADMSYAYDNLHGWTTQIKSAGGFEQNLYRETEGSTPRWNGSISAMTWQTDDSKVHRYDYTYDGLNRLTKADYTSKLLPKQIIQETRGRSIFDPIISPGIIPTNNAKSTVSSQLSLNKLQALIPESDFTNLSIAQTEEPSAAASRSVSASGMISQQRPKVGPYDYTKQHGNYSELAEYDANTNITSLQRYGMKNDKSFGLIDDLSIEHNGNQITSVSDAADENLDYEGAFDFADGDDKNKEYAYNGNGALTMDLNKGIDNIEYDLLGNPIKLTIDNNTKRIEYVYAADGRRLKTKHSYITYVTKPRLHREIFSDSIEYIGNLILKNGKPDMYQFAGGYYSFDGDKRPECYYYIADYQGNNRMVVNAHTNEVEQTTHYYPYGGIIGNLSSNQETQKYKYSGKELDRTYGLDLYDFHARLFNPALPVFDRPDPLAEDFTWLTPYNYCAGDPVNCIDPTGMAWISATYGDQTFYCWDENIKCQEDIAKRYYYGDTKNTHPIQFVGETASVDYNGQTISLGEGGEYQIGDGARQTSETDKDGLHIGSAPKDYQMGDNLYGVYLGGKNPETKNGVSSYCVPPIDGTDYAAFCHDKAYDKAGAAGAKGAFLNTDVCKADMQLSVDCKLNEKEISKMSFSEYRVRRGFWNAGAKTLFVQNAMNKLGIKMVNASSQNPLKY